MLKKLLGYSMATWIGALISFILIPIATHLYTSHDLGVINYYYSIINVVFTIIILAMDQAYMRFYYEVEDCEKRSLFTSNIVLTICVIIILCVCLIPFSGDVSTWLVDENVPLISGIIAIHLVGLTVTRYFVILFRLKGSLLLYTVYSIVNTVLLKCVYIVAYPFRTDSLSAIYATAIISLLISLYLTIRQKKFISLNISSATSDLLRQEMKYAFPLVPAMVFAIFNNNIPQIVLRNETDFLNIAFFSIGVLIASTITLLHNGLNTFLEPYIYNNYKEKKEQISYILEVFSKCAIIICMLVVLFQNVFFLIFKKEYIVSTQFLPILMCSSLWYTIGDFYNIGVKIQKRTYKNIKIYAIGLALNIILCYLLIPKTGCVGAAISAASASALMSILKTIVGNKYYSLIKSYKRLIIGSGLLIIIDIINYFLWNNAIKYVIELVIMIFYVVYSGVIKDLANYINTKGGNR